ncbi:MAG: hypothetical protein K0Q52_1124 [Microbacterium sp.]|nr:hypothetical protein [Microbacterium sp.]
MTARRVVTLTCDKDDCRERYVGGEDQTTAQVRAEARKLSGWWTALRGEAFVDFCRWHS